MTEEKNRNRNNINLKHIRQSLRNNPTAPELILWSKLRSKQLGAKFRRQYGINNYVLDFYCPELRLAIEIDGDSHYLNETLIADKTRDKYLLLIGIKTLRFTNNDITSNINGVLAELLKIIQSYHP